MKKLIVVFIILFSINTFSQHKKEKEVEIVITTNSMKLYLVGGLASPITKETLRFGEKYGITFHDFGCTPPIPIEKYEQHNFQVFDKLRHHFGYQWEKELNITVIGLEKWKQIK